MAILEGAGMLTPHECGQVAELVITTYCRTCECSTPDELKKAGEMLISKMARGIEKYAGTDKAVEVLKRTALHVATPEGGAACN